MIHGVCVVERSEMKYMRDITIHESNILPNSHFSGRRCYIAHLFPACK